jgi:hypothetical protein
VNKVKTMKQLLYIPLFLVLLLSCKKDSIDGATSFADFLTIQGSWHLIEIERTSLDNKNVWESVSATKADTLIFRTDGVILNTDGTPACCAPKSLIINNQLMDIKPQQALPANPLCAAVNCVNCPTWELSLSDDQLIVSSCNNLRRKYVR